MQIPCKHTFDKSLLKIRVAKESDIPAIHDIQEGAFLKRRLSFADLAKGKTAKNGEFVGRFTCFVAEYGDEKLVVGYIVFVLDTWVAWLDDVCVRGKWLRLGIATAMLDALKYRCLINEKTHIEATVWNDYKRAIAFFSSPKARFVSLPKEVIDNHPEFIWNDGFTWMEFCMKYEYPPSKAESNLEAV